MVTRKMMVLGLAVMCVMTLSGEAMARGGNGGGRGSAGGYGVQAQAGQRIQTQAAQRIQTRNTLQNTTTRPADSQRRDGTFLNTGATASGATTRPANGYGLRDGSGLGRTTTNP